MGTQHLPSQTQSQSGQLTQLNEQQLAKLQSELDVVQGNMRVLSEMLAYFTSPDQSCKQQPDSADLELLNVGIFYMCVSLVSINLLNKEIYPIFLFMFLDFSLFL